MEKLVAGEKCTIYEQQLEPLTVSFKRKNIVWKKKYKKYVGQDALVLSLFGDDTIMLKMKNGKIIQFPLESVKRSESQGDDLNKDHEVGGHMKKTLTPSTKVNDRSEGDDLALSMSTREMLKNQKPENLVTEEDKNQLMNSNRRKLSKKKINKMYEVLEALNLSEYYRSLTREGFESLEYLKYAEFEDLRALGLKRGHARRLIWAMEQYRANPRYDFQKRNRRKKASFCCSQTSTSSSNATLKSSIVSLSSIAEHESDESNNFEHSDDLHKNSNESCGWQSELEGSSIRRSSGSASLSSEWHSNERGEDGGYLIVPFTKSSLGFGFMSPFFLGTIVTSIMDKRLKMMGLKIGLPLVQINDKDVSRCSAKEVACILACVGIPCTITFRLEPYYEAGEIDMANNKLYPGVHEGMSHNPEEDTVMDYGSKSTGWHSDYDCRKPLGNLRKIQPQSFLQKRCKESSERLCSSEVSGNVKTPFEKRGEDVQNQLLHCGFVGMQQSYNDKDYTQSLAGRRRNAPIHRYMRTGTNKKMTAILQANLKANVDTAIGYISKMV